MQQQLRRCTGEAAAPEVAADLVDLAVAQAEAAAASVDLAVAQEEVEAGDSPIVHPRDR